MSYIQQNPQLLIFLLILAVLLLLGLIAAAIGIARRNKGGRGLANSTFGNNIDEGRVVNQGNSKSGDARPGHPKWDVDQVDTAPSSDKMNERR